MNEYSKLVKKRVFYTLLFNPAFILVYGVAWEDVKILSKAGPIKGNIESLVTCFIFFVYWSMIYLIMILKNPQDLERKVFDDYLIDKLGITIMAKKRLQLDFEDMWNYIITKSYLFIAMKDGSIVILNNKKIIENSDYSEMIKSNKKNMSKFISIWNIICLIVIILIPIAIIVLR